MSDNNHIYNSISKSKSTSMKDLLNEIERGDNGYVEKHKSIATVYRVMSGGKKLQVKLGKTGKKVVIDAKDIDILPESTINERPRQLKDKNKEMLVVKDGKVIVIDKKDWKKYQKKGYLVAESIVNEASGEFVVYIERDNGRKKLLHTKKSQRAANMFMTKNRDKILNKPGIRLIGSMSKDEWEKTEARFAENIKKSDMKTITKKEWDRKHKDFKGIVKGQPYMMYYDKDTQSTVYGPVNIKESVNEVVSKTYKIPTQKGTLHLEVETDSDGVIVDVIFNRVMLSTVDIQFPTGKVEVQQRYKKVKLKESVVNEAEKMKMSTSQMKQLHKAFDKTSDDDFRRAMFSVVKRDKFLKLISSFDKSSLQNLVKMKPNAPFSKAVQAYLDGKIKEGVVNEIKKGSIIRPFAHDKEGDFIVDKVFKNKDGETSYTGKFKKSGKKKEFILHSKDKIVKEGVVNERKYSNQTGTKTALLRDTQFKNLVSPKEQKWIKGNDVKIFASTSRSEFIFTDGKLEMVMSPLRPFEILKPLGRVSSEIKKLYQQNESIVNEAIKYNKDGFVTKMENEAGKVVKDITLDGEKFVLNGNKYVSKKGGKDLHKSHFGIKESTVNEGKFKKDDLVYNKRTKTVGIVRLGDDKYGEVKTDADGNVSVDELEKYNPIKFKHQSKAKVAPSTEKEVNSRGLFNPFKNESVNESLLTEATRSQVGIIDKSGNIISTYVHYDGYPGYVGKILKQAYNGAKTKQLLKIAGKDGVSVLGRDIKGAPGHSFENPVKGQTIFYGRDRGDSGNNMMMKGKVDNLERYVKSAESQAGAEYIYLYDENSKKWFYIDIGKSRTEYYPL